MKIPIVFSLVISLWSMNSEATEFEHDGWPGEGIPAFSAKHSVLHLHKEPNSNSESVDITVEERGFIGNIEISKSEINYDRSKVITNRSVILTAKATVTDAICPSQPAATVAPVIQPGESIEYLQYYAEGYAFVRYKGMICEVFIADREAKFDGLDKHPDVEWWVRLIDSGNQILGWLLVDEAQINQLPRTF
jgi:hypothetical protein